MIEQDLNSRLTEIYDLTSLVESTFVAIGTRLKDISWYRVAFDANCNKLCSYTLNPKGQVRGPNKSFDIKDFHSKEKGLHVWELPEGFDITTPFDIKNPEHLKLIRNTPETEPLDVPIITNIQEILDEMIMSYKELIAIPVTDRVDCEKSCARDYEQNDFLPTPTEHFGTFGEDLERRYDQAITRSEMQIDEILEIKKDTQKIINILKQEYTDLIQLPDEERLQYLTLDYSFENVFPDNDHFRLKAIKEQLYPLEEFLKKLDIDEEKEETDITLEDLKLELKEIQRLEKEHMKIYELVKKVKPSLDVINNRIIYLEFIIDMLEKGGSDYHKKEENEFNYPVSLSYFPAIDEIKNYIQNLRDDPHYEIYSDDMFDKFILKFKLSFPERKKLETLLDSSHQKRSCFDPLDSSSFFTLNEKSELGWNKEEIRSYEPELILDKLAPKKPNIFTTKTIPELVDLEKATREVRIQNPTEFFSEEDIQVIIDKYEGLSDFYRVVETIKEYYEWIEKRKSELSILTSVPNEILKKVHECIRVIKKGSR